MKYCPRSCTCRVPDASDFEWTLADHLHSWRDDFIDWATGIMGGPLLRWTLRTPWIREDPDRLWALVGRMTFDVWASLDDDERRQLLDAVASAARTRLRDELTEWQEVIEGELRRREEER